MTLSRIAAAFTGAAVLLTLALSGANPASAAETAPVVSPSSFASEQAPPVSVTFTLTTTLTRNLKPILSVGFKDFTLPAFTGGGSTYPGGVDYYVDPQGSGTVVTCDFTPIGGAIITWTSSMLAGNVDVTHPGVGDCAASIMDDGWVYYSLWVSSLDTNVLTPGTQVTLQIAAGGLTAPRTGGLYDFVALSDDGNWNGSSVLDTTTAQVWVTGGSSPVPDWNQSVGRASANATCEAGWAPSWQEWAVRVTGGWVCTRSIPMYGG